MLTSQIKSGLLAAALIFGLLLTLPSAAQKTQNQQNSELIPFFDNEDNPVPLNFPPGQQLDISPPAPKLNVFDEAVLQTCGSIGSNVLPDRFKQLLRKHPDVLEKVRQAVGGEIRPGRKRRSDFLQDLTNIWFKRKGFEHIFCGEIYNANDIGGLHFYGRYLQLQNQGIGGRLSNNQKHQEVVPGVIYTMGVVIKQPNRIVTDVIKGYGYLSNAEEMLVDATKIFKQQGNNEGACVYNVRDNDTGKTFPTVFVRREGAIITYYPDATPKGSNCKGSQASL
jgi:Bacterial EndoU nuclease